MAETPHCLRYKAELAALPRGGNRVMAAAAERQRAEIGRLETYVRQIGCDRGAAAPAECGTMQERLRRMETNLKHLQAQAGSADGDQRRRTLQAAARQACAYSEAPRPSPQAKTPEPARPSIPMAGSRTAPRRNLACVRTCDGYFFPLSNAPAGRDGPDAMCQALCPGAETTAYALGGRHDGLARAVSFRAREPYVQAPHAFRFRTSLDRACACKRPEETWASLLREAESLIARRKGDIVVTAETSDALAGPRQAASPGKLAPIEARAGAPEPTRTGGIAPGPAGDEETDRGERPNRRAVRVIAPHIVPVPIGR